MADYWIVLAHKGEGWIGGLFTNYSDASAYVSTTPKWAVEIMKVTLDSHVGQNMNVHLLLEKPVRNTASLPGSGQQGVAP